MHAADNRAMNSSPTDAPAGPRGPMRVVLGVALSLALALSPAWAASEGDHDRARAAVEAGEILPLPALLEQVQRTHPGQVLALELETQGGRWIYEMKLLQPDGRLLKLVVDARTAQVLKLKSKSAGSPGQ